MRQKNYKNLLLLLVEFSQRSIARFFKIENKLLLEEPSAQNEVKNHSIKANKQLSFMYLYYKIVFVGFVVVLIFSFTLYNVFPNLTNADIEKKISNQVFPEDNLDYEITSNTKINKSYKPNDLVNIKINGAGYLRTDAYKMLRELYKDASINGFKFKVYLAYMDYNDCMKLGNVLCDPELSELRLGNTVYLICDNCNDITESEDNTKLWMYLEKISFNYGFSNTETYKPQKYKFRYFGI